ncbi:MAG: DoxX family protein [Nocardioides sp.]
MRFRPDLAIPGSVRSVRAYWLAVGVFTAVFLGSAILTLGDLEASYAVYRRLGFTAEWQVFFNGIGKLLGLLAILHNRSHTLKLFAYAGFLVDLLLALCAHLARMEPDVLLAVGGLGVWALAFGMDRVAYGPRRPDVGPS